MDILSVGLLRRGGVKEYQFSTQKKCFFGGLKKKITKKAQVAIAT